MRTIVTTLAVATVVGVVGGLAFLYSGIYDVSASDPDSDLAQWVLSTAMHASVERRASDVDVPDLDRQEARLAGANDYASMCAGCHGAPGQQPEAAGQGLNPPAPDLAESAAHMSEAELFWVTKHGIRMTGMPAWGVTHDDDDLWPVVAFITTLPGLDADGYQAVLRSAEGIGHHGPAATSHDEANSHEHGEDGDHGQTAAVDDHSTRTEEPSAQAPKVEEEEHDHSDHAH